MDMTFKELVQTFGLPGAVFIVVIAAFMFRRIITAAEFTEYKADRAKEREEERERYEAMAREKDMWRDLALRTVDLSRQAVDTADKAASTLLNRDNRQ